MKIINVCLLILLCSNPVYADSWQSLFNGKNFSGWHWQKYGGDANYKIENGAIVGINGPRHNTFLATTKTYANFELTFEVFLPNKLNSGVQIRSHIKDELNKNKLLETHLYGPQVEIEQSPGQSGYIYGEKLDTGWLTPEAKNKSHSFFKNNDWNAYKIIADGPRIQTWVNGQLVSDYSDEKLYAQHYEGTIGLQVHATKQDTGTLQVKWRNLKIKELPTTKNVWKTIFNGYSYAGWIPKVAGYELGENPGNIFSIKNGAMHLDHKAFFAHEGRFAHLFYKKPYSNYRLKFKYRFLDHLVANAPKYAYRNSGLMFHSENPTSIAKYQAFPISVEAQFLGSDKHKKQSTGNVCTPGTDISQNAKKVESHCVKSSSSDYFDDKWVEMEIKVSSDKEVIQYIEGKEVLRYQSPRLDDGTPLTSGWIALQAEGHELEIKDVQLMEL